MIVTLKKAAALATALAAVTKPLPLKATLSVFSETDLGTLLEATIKMRDDALADALKRTQTVYIIREAIGQANTSDINRLLTRRASIDKQLEILNKVPVVSLEPDLDAITHKRDAMRNRDTTGYGASETFTVDLPAPGVIVAIKTLKRERLTVEDKLAELNFITTIELPDDVVQVLQDNDLI